MGSKGRLSDASASCGFAAYTPATNEFKLQTVRFVTMRVQSALWSADSACCTLRDHESHYSVLSDSQKP